MHKISLTMSLFHASTCFEHHVLIIRRAKLYYTASGIITPCLYMFRAHVLIIRRSKLYYTASGIITPYLYMFRAPCAHHQEVKIVLYSLWYHHTMPLHDSSTVCSSSGGQNCIIQPLVSLHHTSTCFEHHVLIIRRSKLYYTASGIMTLKQVRGPKLLKYNSINMSTY